MANEPVKKGATETAGAQRAADGRKEAQQLSTAALLGAILSLRPGEATRESHWVGYVEELAERIGEGVKKHSRLMFWAVLLGVVVVGLREHWHWVEMVASSGGVVALGGVAIDTFGYQATAPGAGGAAGVAIAGDSLTTKNAALNNSPWIAAWWAKNQANGVHQLTWPSGHDQTRGIRSRVVAGFVYPRYALEFSPPINPQETIATFVIGSAVGGQTEIGVIQAYYEDLPGIAARLIAPDVLQSRGVHALTIEDTTGALTSVLWSGSRLINAASDLLRANTDYAVLGGNVGVACACLALRGADTGNLRIGIPGEPENAELTEQYFVNMSRALGVACIPVINSANKGATFTDCLQDQAVTVVPFSWNLVELAPA